MTGTKNLVPTLAMIVCSLMAATAAEAQNTSVVSESGRAIEAAAPQIGVPVNLSGASDQAIVTVTNTGAATGGGVGVSGNAPLGYGIQGSGLIGVNGNGGSNGTGVSGISGGAGTGVLGQSVGGRGVVGVSNSIGVYGESTGDNGSGVAATGKSFGVSAKSENTAVYGLSTSTNPKLESAGIAGINTSGGNAAYFLGPVRVVGALNVTGGCTGCSPPSDRNLKSNFSIINSRLILARLASVPVQSWNYKSEGDLIRHIGPTAQDFRAAFGLGDSDRTINTIDADGVALAAIQALYQMMQEKDRRIERLQARLLRLERRGGKRPSRKVPR